MQVFYQISGDMVLINVMLRYNLIKAAIFFTFELN